MADQPDSARDDSAPSDRPRDDSASPGSPRDDNALDDSAGAALPREHTATAPTLPGADIRHARPVDDPDSLGASEYYAGSPSAESDGSTEPEPPVAVVSPPD